MSKKLSSLRSMILGFAVVAAFMFMFAIDLGTGKAARVDVNSPAVPPGQAYRQRNLISDVPGMAAVLDPLLINPWGISLSGSGPFWVANNGTSTSGLYRSATPFDTTTINPGLSSVTIPGGLPTGTVVSPTATDFVLPGPCATPPCGANFLFASITGNITGWDPNAPAAGSTQAVIAASQPGHVYTGLAIGSNAGGNRLYAADFANGNIDVYNQTFGLTTVSGGFADPTIPQAVGNDYHPFNIQNVGGQLYVAYAKVGPDGRDEPGIGKGYVRRFNTDGVRDMGFAINQGELNAPWAVTVAPATFGIFGGALLVGNFGEGNPSIHAYNPTTGAFLGTLQDEGGTGIVIDKLWDLKFGNGGTGGDPNVLYFAAGPAAEEHGLFGSLSPTTVEAPALVRFLSATYSVVEPLGPININVIRSGDLSGTTTVNFSALTESSAGHAGAGDFTLNPGSVTFAPGEFIKTFPVAITPDALVEGQETLQLVLSNPTGAGLSSPNIARLTIADLTTAAGVSVSGRVLTPGGQGLRNAVVTLTDSQGEARSVTTGSFGYFRFEDVEVGHTYAIAVLSKRFRFATRSVNVVDELTDVDFVGLE